MENKMDWKDIWTEKYRPKILQDVLISDETRKFLEELKNNSKNTGGVPNMLFSGPPGTGKTSICKIIAEDILDSEYIYINGSEESSIDTVRNKIMGFAQTKSFDGKIKLVIIDEMEGMSSANYLSRTSAQQALRNVMEEYSSNTRFLFTTNYPDRIIEPIHSRVLHINFNLSVADCIKKCIFILKNENVQIQTEQKDRLRCLVERLCPDLRNIIIQLQKFSSSGVLNIKEIYDYNDLCRSLFEYLLKKEDLIKIREYVISNNKDLTVDYHEILKNLFNYILDDKTQLKNDTKIKCCLIISDSMVDHFTVSDKEINFSACLFRLSQVI
jgi:DNA polymerase III delta prime subunit